jgi:hypothetical protein
MIVRHPESDEAVHTGLVVPDVSGVRTVIEYRRIFRCSRDGSINSTYSKTSPVHGIHHCD